MKGILRIFFPVLFAATSAWADATIGGVTCADLTTPGAGTAVTNTAPYAGYTMLGCFDGTWAGSDDRGMCPYSTAYPGMCVGYAFNSATAVNAYSIRNGGTGSSAADLRAPNTWTFEGSDDGTTWTVLDSRSGEKNWVSGEVRLYRFVNTKAYGHYRYSCTALNGRTDCFQVHEIEFYYIETLQLGACSATASGSSAISVTASVAMATASSVTACATAENGTSVSALIGENVAAGNGVTGLITGLSADTIYLVSVVAANSTTMVTNNLGAVYTGELIHEMALGPGDDLRAAVTNSLWKHFACTIYLEPGAYPVDKELVLPEKLSLVGQSGKPEDVVLYANRGTKMFRTMTVSGGASLVANMVISNGNNNGGNGANLALTGGTVSNCVLKAALLGGNNSGGSAYLNGVSALLTHSVVDGSDAQGPDSGWMAEYGVGVHVAKGRVENALVKNAHALMTTNNVSTGATPANTTALKSAGGIYLAGPGASAVNCTVVDCSATRAGGIWAKAGAVAQNCVVAGCEQTGVWVEKGPLVTTNSTIVSEGTVANCATDDAVKFNGTCVIGTAATFFRDCAGGLYAPKAAGPLRDAGVTPAGWAAAGFVDLAGRPRVAGQSVDIGAYEGVAAGFLMIIR